MRVDTSHKLQPESFTRQEMDAQTRAWMECHVVCDKLCEQLASGALPPDEAYWWTRIALEELARVDRRAVVG